MGAAYKGHVNVLKELLSRGAEMDRVNSVSDSINSPHRTSICRFIFIFRMVTLLSVKLQVMVIST